MSLSARRQLGLLWGANSVLLLGLSLFAERVVAIVPACHIKSLVGIPCPGCGLTTTAFLLAQFDPAGALRVSPLATLFWLLLVGGGVLAGALALTGKVDRFSSHLADRLPVWLSLRSLERNFGFRMALLGVIGANWLYLLVSQASLGG